MDEFGFSVLLDKKSYSVGESDGSNALVVGTVFICKEGDDEARDFPLFLLVDDMESEVLLLVNTLTALLCVRTLVWMCTNASQPTISVHRYVNMHTWVAMINIEL